MYQLYTGKQCPPINVLTVTIYTPPNHWIKSNLYLLYKAKPLLSLESNANNFYKANTRVTFLVYYCVLPPRMRGPANKHMHNLNQY